MELCVQSHEPWGQGFCRGNKALIFSEASRRWLTNHEVLDLILHFPDYGFELSREPSERPPSGSLFIFDKTLTKRFRKDGHNWKKKKDGKQVREDHVKLKIDKKEVLNCCYAHCDDSETFHRRCYWVLDPNASIVVVHYLDESIIQNHPEAKRRDRKRSEKSSVSPLTDSNSQSQSEHLSTPTLNTEILIHSCPQAPFFMINSHADALSQLEYDKQPSFHEITKIPGFGIHKIDALEPDQKQLKKVKEAPKALNASPNCKKTTLRQVQDDCGYPERNNHPEHLSRWKKDSQYCQSPNLLHSNSSESSPTMQILQIESDIKHLEDTKKELIAQKQKLLTKPKVEEIYIKEFCPDWDFAVGGSKILVCLSAPIINESVECFFGNIRVPADRISNEVFRCVAPACDNREVPFMALTSSGLTICSEDRPTFRYVHYTTNEKPAHVKVVHKMAKGRFPLNTSVQTETRLISPYTSNESSQMSVTAGSRMSVSMAGTSDTMIGDPKSMSSAFELQRLNGWNPGLHYPNTSRDKKDKNKRPKQPKFDTFDFGNDITDSTGYNIFEKELENDRVFPHYDPNLYFPSLDWQQPFVSIPEITFQEDDFDNLIEDSFP